MKKAAMPNAKKVRPRVAVSPSWPKISIAIPAIGEPRVPPIPHIIANAPHPATSDAPEKRSPSSTSATGTYTVALVELGDRFSGGALVAGCGAFSMMWGIGGTLGSPIAGIAMDIFGQEGLTATLGLTFLALGIAAFLMPLSRSR